MTTTRDILIAARALIADPERWTRRVSARAAAEKVCDATDDAAVAWCATGAIERCVSDDTEWQDALEALRSVLVPTTLITGHITAWNDRPSTTHADVLAAFDRAIERSRRR